MGAAKNTGKLSQPVYITEMPSVVLDASDIEIGAVEIKNGSDDTRATVNASNELLVKDTAGEASLSVMDDWDESDRAKVNLIAGQAGILGGSGVDATNVPRVTLATNVALPAGEAHLGAIGGNTAYISSTPTLTVAGAYSTGDYIGTTTTPASFLTVVRTSAGTGTIKSIVIKDYNTSAAVALELWLFSATFTAPTDNAAWAITDAESLTCLGVIPITTTKWYASSNNKIYSDDTLGLVIKPAVTTLFYGLVARGTTPTWVSGDLTITLGILQD